MNLHGLEELRNCSEEDIINLAMVINNPDCPDSAKVAAMALVMVGAILNSKVFFLLRTTYKDPHLVGLALDMMKETWKKAYES